jgi:hypothetical protein
MASVAMQSYRAWCGVLSLLSSLLRGSQPPAVRRAIRRCRSVHGQYGLPSDGHAPRAPPPTRTSHDQKYGVNRVLTLALFNLAIDSKLRSCDLMKLRVRDVCGSARNRHWVCIMVILTGHSRTQTALDVRLAGETGFFCFSSDCGRVLTKTGAPNWPLCLRITLC